MPLSLLYWRLRDGKAVGWFFTCGLLESIQDTVNSQRQGNTWDQSWNPVSLKRRISLCHLLSDLRCFWIGFLVVSGCWVASEFLCSCSLKNRIAHQINVASLRLSSLLYNPLLHSGLQEASSFPTFFFLSLHDLSECSGWQERNLLDLDVSILCSPSILSQPPRWFPKGRVFVPFSASKVILLLMSRVWWLFALASNY